MTTETLNSIEGVSCNEVMGAMYAFPRFHLPDKAIAAAEVSISPALISIAVYKCEPRTSGYVIS